jgi:hypothetical protein
MKNGVFWVLGRVALVTPYISEECIASVIRMRRVSELGTSLAIISKELCIGSV